MPEFSGPPTTIEVPAARHLGRILGSDGERVNSKA
jgi:hypothetical protein